jgi:hypothetical protein
MEVLALTTPAKEQDVDFTHDAIADFCASFFQVRFDRLTLVESCPG